MPDYQKGKIYKVLDNSYTKCYIGSTCEDLCRRMAQHKWQYKEWVKNRDMYFHYSIYDLFDEFDVDGCKIELLENFPCMNRTELIQREGQHQRDNDCLNKNVAGRTPKMYREENKEALQQRNQNHYKANSEKIKQNAIERYYDKREEISTQKHIYHEKNKGKKKQYNQEHRDKFYQIRVEKDSVRHSCECGGQYIYSTKSRHLKSSKHQNYINQINQQEQL